MTLMIPAVALAVVVGGATLPSGESQSAAADRFLRRSLNGTPYRIFVPGAYDGRSNRPLVLFLHGGAGRGRDNALQLAEGNGMLAQMFASGEQAFVLAAQTNTGHDVKTTLAILDAVRTEYRIDPRRIYVVGQSLGGLGALDMLSARADVFAAAVVIAAGGEAGRAARLAPLPIWFFHGERDEVFPVEQPRLMVAALKEAGSAVRFTEYAGEGHGLAWLVVRERELVPWLLSQSRPAR